jgi:alanyl-tRNA synthetase
MIQRWKEDRKATAKRIRSLLDETLEIEAQKIVETAHPVGSHKLVSVVFKDRDPDEVQTLMNKIIRHDDMVVFLGLISDRAYLYFGRSHSVDLDIRPFMESACQLVQGKGGGSPSMARGSGTETSKAEETIEKMVLLYMKQTSQLSS